MEFVWALIYLLAVSASDATSKRDDNIVASIARPLHPDAVF